MKPITHVNIIANRWFQRSAGNTYHRVTIAIYHGDGAPTLLDSGIHYGYGEQWDQTALDVYLAHIEEPKTRQHPAYLTTYLRDGGFQYSQAVNDVRRERDL